MIELNKIYNMDCLEGLRLLEDNSIDSIVTDPPYELGFMGKSWDKTGIAYNIELWEECLRVLKPGGHLLAFGGTRTYHRMACAIEDAGFEIRDQIQWIYGSGFPKSHNISKAIDKKFGAKREVIERKVSKSGGMAHIMKTNKEQGYRPNDYYEVKGNIIEITVPSTNLAKQWDGWGTALKPAHEPIVLARKPLSEKTIVDNVLKWGTGGINIDESRIPSDDADLTRKSRANKKEKSRRSQVPKISEDMISDVNKGRFPANIILDEEAGRLLDEQSGILKSGALKPYQENHQNASSYKMNRYKTFVQPANEGGASRFFYCAKASKKEKGEYNNHPTVKPIKLMEYLVNLVTPKGGVVLDPFAGSGSTLIAAKNKGFNYLGIEKEEEYIEIANKRLSEQNK